MIEGAKTAKPRTMNDLLAQAGDLTVDLRNVCGRLNRVYDAMSGDQARVESEEGKDQGNAGSISGISSRMRDASDLISQIKQGLSEIESIVLPEKVEVPG